MPIGAFKLNGISKFVVTAAGEVIRKKKGIIALGNAKVSTAQSKFGGSSGIFDGTGDYISIESIPLGSTDFTIEMWFRVTSMPPTDCNLFDQRAGNDSAPYVRLLNNGSIGFGYGYNEQILTSSGAVTTATWYHFAVSKYNNSTKMFINGTQVGSTYSDSRTYTSPALTTFGQYNPAYFSGGYALNGHIDEIRMSSSARYTGNFTAPTTPFTNDANTLLLIHMDGTNASTYFEDDNGVRTPKGISALGNAKVSTAQSKFGGASALFDGTGDYLKIPTDSDLQFTSSESWTVELWFRPSTVSGADQRHMLATYALSGSFNGWAFKIGQGSGTDGICYFWDGVSWRAFNTTVTTNTWYHAAIVSNAGSCKMYLNGTEQTTTFTATSSINNTTDNLAIGSRVDGSNGWNGYMDEIRISNSARYTSSFTAPTTPFINDANTLLLIHADGTNGSTVFRDDVGSRSQKSIIANGNAQIDTAQSKFGNSSLLLDGTGDYLAIPYHSDFAYGTNDWTIEFWIRFNALSTVDNKIVWEQRPAFTNGAYPAIYITTAQKIIYYVNTANRCVGTTTLTTNTWYHIAVSRSGTSTKLFVNGTQEGSTYTDSNNYITNTTELRIAQSFDPSYPDNVNGWMDEIRVSNSARYTSNFTAPTAAFQNDANTLLLIHADGTDASTTFIDDNGKTPT